MKAVILDEVESTNDYLKSLPQAEDWTAVVAFRQTGGKGTKGRRFASPTGGLYMSVILKPDDKKLSLITPMAAVAVRRAIKELLNIDCGIKWVNDLYKDGRKICGILTENKFSDGKISTVIGIGIDVFKAKDGYGEFDSVAGFLLDGSYDKSVIVALAEKIIEELKSLYCVDNGAFIEEYAENSLLNGKTVVLKRGEKEETVMVVGVDKDARLLVIHDDGSEEAVISGDVIWKDRI